MQHAQVGFNLDSSQIHVAAVQPFFVHCTISSVLPCCKWSTLVSSIQSGLVHLIQGASRIPPGQVTKLRCFCGTIGNQYNSWDSIQQVILEESHIYIHHNSIDDLSESVSRTSVAAGIVSSVVPHPRNYSVFPF